MRLQVISAGDVRSSTLGRPRSGGRGEIHGPAFEVASADVRRRGAGSWTRVSDTTSAGGRRPWPWPLGSVSIQGPVGSHDFLLPALPLALEPPRHSLYRRLSPPRPPTPLAPADEEGPPPTETSGGREFRAHGSARITEERQGVGQGRRSPLRRARERGRSRRPSRRSSARVGASGLALV